MQIYVSGVHVDGDDDTNSVGIVVYHGHLARDLRRHGQDARGTGKFNVA